MSQAKPTKIANAWQLYSRLLVYVKRYWLALVIGGVASMIYSSVDAILVYSLEPLLNKGLIAKNKEFLRMAPFWILGIFVARGIASFLSNYFIAYSSRNVIMNIRQDLFAHLQRLPAKFYDHTTSGQLLSVILYSVDQVANASADVLTTAIQALFLIVGLIYVMVNISWKLTLMFFLIIPLVTIIMRVASLRIRRLSLSVQESVGDISHNAEENIEGYKVVRAFSGQAYETKKFNRAVKVNRQREMKVVVARAISVTAVQLTMAVALAITLYIATLDIADSVLSPGGFAAMITAMLSLLKPMKDLAFVQNKLYRGLAGAQKVFELMDEQPEVDQGQISMMRAKGDIAFKNVGFAYTENHPVLADINFTIKPGEVVALVGRSGSGKSTLANLLPRFYNDYTGEITLDGLSIRDIRLQDLRRQFGLVTQQVTLFHDTIANNIAYGYQGVVLRSAIEQAAASANVLEFASKLPNGLDTMVGENGVLLSGGQRQRIAIARAILINAPILILDEATSALDTESERFIQNALEQLMKSRTTLVIAHRLSTVEHADQIIVLDHGRIVEMGHHRELLARNGHYAKLYRMQFLEPNESSAF